MAPTPYEGFQPRFFRLQWLDEHVLGVAFARPPVNAFHSAMWAEMHRIFSHIRGDGLVRVVVLYGEGKCFTGGLDLRDPVLLEVNEKGTDAARRALLFRDLIDRFQAAITSIETCERPVIGVSHNHCIGLAIDILSTVDIRYTAADAQFSIREAAIGLAADIGTLQRFPKVVGNDSLARELAFTARNFTADEAREVGFVSRVFPTFDAALQGAVATARRIASLSPVAVVGTKMALVHARDHSVDAGLRFMQYLNAAMLQTDDLPVAIGAALSKTQPSFAKL
ncbi:hypothetical protein MNAN1_002663 [Malassezia nana]|uniref:Delta(3,5)-Delta(2,4)-dienoyl-CoA isomerase, mitochondrial n=1 Tax=Malassezia nana TaxID=180528 RepID=A0AAF0ESR9_9BASI|nr:hypothetical protein MNAN1_002663 [Malassezia nana]